MNVFKKLSKKVATKWTFVLPWKSSNEYNRKYISVIKRSYCHKMDLYPALFSFCVRLMEYNAHIVYSE